MRSAVLIGVALCAGCSLVPQRLAEEPPPLHDLEEPLELYVEPGDEALRQALDPGSFTGIHASDARASLTELLSEPDGVRVARVVENSPADIAGIEAGDLLVEARSGDRTVALRWPGEWRKLEVEARPGAEVELVFDRAGAERRARLVTVARARPAERDAAARFREDARVGVVVRTATEVEGRAAGLGPGGGAVIVGLARGSPWRKDGLVYGDCITRAGGKEVVHPEVLLGAIRTAEPDARLALDFVRAGVAGHVEARVSRRESELHEIWIPLIFSYSNDRGHCTTSFLLGLYKHESTKAAWKTHILWFISFSGGDSDRLEEEKS